MPFLLLLTGVGLVDVISPADVCCRLFEGIGHPLCTARGANERTIVAGGCDSRSLADAKAALAARNTVSTLIRPGHIEVTPQATSPARSTGRSPSKLRVSKPSEGK